MTLLSAAPSNAGTSVVCGGIGSGIGSRTGGGGGGGVGNRGGGGGGGVGSLATTTSTTGASSGCTSATSDFGAGGACVSGGGPYPYHHPNQYDPAAGAGAGCCAAEASDVSLFSLPSTASLLSPCVSVASASEGCSDGALVDGVADFVVMSGGVVAATGKDES